LAFLQGVFSKNRVLDVVFCWCGCGDLRGKRGVLAVTFSALKNTPTFRDLFFGVWFRQARLP
jgi:hypothetical protein